MAVFGDNGGRNLRFWFRDPPKNTSLRGTTSFDVFCVKIVARVSAVAFLKNPPQKVAESLFAEGREITHAQNRNPWTDLDKILHDGRYRRRCYVHKIIVKNLTVYNIL